MNFLKASTKSQYALRLMVNIASKRGETVSLAEVSEEEKISYGYLEEIARPLKKAGILISKSGRNGGYLLAREPEEIKISEIIEIFEGKIAPVRCLEGSKCYKESSCRTKKVWARLQESVHSALSSIKLADII